VFRFVSLAAAVGGATGLSLRSPHPCKIFCPPAAHLAGRAGILTACAAARLRRRPMAPACLPPPEHTPQQARRHAGQACERSTMNVTVPATTLITCAAPTCDTRVPATESVYIDGAGQLCEACAGPLPEWARDIELPY